MARELLKRGIQVDYLNQDSFDPTTKSSKEFLAKIPVQKISNVQPDQKNFWQLDSIEFKSVTDYSCILQRLDPPVNQTFIAHAKLFDFTPKNILQINNPRSTIKYSEHGLPLMFPNMSTPTRIVGSVLEFQNALKDFGPNDGVAKPYNECSGNGIEFLPPNTTSAVLKAYLDRWGPKVIVQKFIPEISTLGDLRILVINQKILGSVTRIPAPGSRLGNLHQGASAKLMKPTQQQTQAALEVAKKLAPEGLHFLGLDFIGEFLNEVNITSPSALVQVNEVTGTDHFPALIDEIEALRQTL